FHSVPARRSSDLLPLIALGIFSVLLAAGDATGRLPFLDGADDVVGAASSRGEGCFGDVPAERTFSIEAGVEARDLLGPRESLDEPFVLRLNRGGATFGELHIRFFPEDDLFTVVDAVDAACNALTGIENSSRGGDPYSLQNWDTLEVEAGGRTFALRLGEDGGVLGLDYFRQIAD